MLKVSQNFINKTEYFLIGADENNMELLMKDRQEKTIKDQNKNLEFRSNWHFPIHQKKQLGRPHEVLSIPP